MADAMTTQEVLNAIARERERLIQAVRALGESAATLSVTDEGWTAKDVLAHLIHWATQIAFGLGAEVQPPVYMEEERQRREAAGNAERPTGDESNAMAVAHYGDMSLGQVRDEFEGVVDALVARVRMRTDAQMSATDAVPWAGRRPLWQQVGGETFLHWPAHSDAIERASRSPKEA